MKSLRLDDGEASALCYFIAYAALVHQKKGKLTPHENSLVTKVSQMDKESYDMWTSAVLNANRKVEEHES